MRAKYGVSFSYASKGIYSQCYRFCHKGVFDINSIFKNKGHNLKVIWTLTLVSLEKVMQVEYTCQI